MDSYISITGFKYLEEVENIKDFFSKFNLNKYSTKFKFAFGIGCSYKRLLDPFKEGVHSPSLNKLSKIVKLPPKNSFSILHYSPKSSDKFYNDIVELFAHNNLIANCSHLQLTTLWPDITEIKRIKLLFRNLKIILQVPLYKLKSFSIDYILKNMDLYINDVDCISIDHSGGTGSDIKYKITSNMISHIRKKNSNINVCVCGGIDADNVSKTIRHFRNELKYAISLDAQSKLHSNVSNSLDSNKAINYITNAFGNL